MAAAEAQADADAKATAAQNGWPPPPPCIITPAQLSTGQTACLDTPERQAWQQQVQAIQAANADAKAAAHAQAAVAAANAKARADAAAKAAAPPNCNGVSIPYTDKLRAVVGNTLFKAVVTCPVTDPATGDISQQTDGGVLYRRASTAYTTFTDGSTHWTYAQDPDGTNDALVWTTGETDAPDGATTVSQQKAAADAAAQPVNPQVADQTPPVESPAPTTPPQPDPAALQQRLIFFGLVNNDVSVCAASSARLAQIERNERLGLPVYSPTSEVGQVYVGGAQTIATFLDRIPPPAGYEQVATLYSNALHENVTGWQAAAAGDSASAQAHFDNCNRILLYGYSLTQ